MYRCYLGEFEELVLLSIAALYDNAYGVSVAHEIRKQTGRQARINQVHSALNRLENKGMVESEMGKPTSERGGRRKRLFRLTAYGQSTIVEIQSIRTKFWNMIPFGLNSG